MKTLQHIHTRFFTAFCFFFFIGGAAAQNNTGSVHGTVIDSATGAGLKDATVAIMLAKDSTIVSSQSSRDNGGFAFSTIPFNTYILKITFQGFSDYQQVFTLSSKAQSFRPSAIMLQPAPKDLGVVIVKAAPTITVKGDTTEFSASRFQTKPNATAEDLLKKIPGMEVEKDGSMKAQGEVVTKVYVDGKPFFTNDPKLATRNLPVDVIDKVQIIDAISDQSAFNSFDDGVQEKVINIITKKDKRKGYFGKGHLAVGNDGRYGSNFNLNRFNGDRKISLVGQANNTSQENLSIADIADIVNSGGFGRGGFGNFDETQGGMARTYEGGLNYSDRLSQKTELNGSYHYGNSNAINQRSSLRETFVAGDSSLFNDNRSYSNNRNIHHRLHFELEHKFDTMTSILVRPSYSYQKSNNFSESHSYLTRGKTNTERDVRTVNNSLTESSNFTNRMLFRHRFAKRGRTLSVNLDQDYSNNNTHRTALNFTNNYFTSNGKTDTTNRITAIKSNRESANINLSYTEPISKNSQVEVNLVYDHNYNNSNQQTNTYNTTTQQYDIVDTILSNHFKNTNTHRRAGFNYRMQINKLWNYTVGLAVQRVDISSNNQTKSRLLTQSFTNYIPTATLQYRKNRTENFRLSYRGNNRLPNIYQLQDVVDNSNLLHITRGNPGLKQEFSNNINFRYTKANRATSSNFIVRLNASIIQNKIANALTINSSQNPILIDNIVLEPLAQYTRPVNVSGVYVMRGFINWGFPVKSLKANLNLGSNLSHNRDVNLVNDVKNLTNNYSLGQSVRLTFAVKDHFDLNFSSSSTYNIVRYSLRPQQNGNFFTQVFSIEPSFYSKGWLIQSDFDYTKTTGQAAGFNQSLPLLNASVARQFFSKKQGELKLSVFDLLNQNRSITRRVEQNFIEDVRSTVLRRYFLLSFTYNLRHFGS